MKTCFVSLAALCSLFTAVNPTFAQGSEFTYQGRFTQSGTNFTGDVEFRFSLWNGASAGNPVTETNTVIVAVNNGSFSVPLDFGAGAFPGADRWVQIEARTVIGPFTTLTPRQKVTATPYAMTAGNVTGSVPAAQVTGLLPASQVSGTLSLAQLPASVVTNHATNLTLDGSFTGNGGGLTNLTVDAANVVGQLAASQLAPGAAAANLQTSGQAGVPGGGMILASNFNDGNLFSAGYLRIGKVDLGNVWEQREGGTPPSVRSMHTAVWTGSEMIVWGGNYDGLWRNDGGRFNPTSNIWAAVTTNNAPTARVSHTAVWIGSEMIIWGGQDRSGPLSLPTDVRRYSPLSNSWTTGTSANAPLGRTFYTAVWTGSEMIVWGGFDDSGNSLNDGGRYNPSVDSWTAVSTTNAPVGRRGHTAVWTGREMIVWGGIDATGKWLNDGGRYDPATNTWTVVTTNGAPAGRSGLRAVWTGSKMIIWGGEDGSNIFTDIRLYDPAADSWTMGTSAGAPVGRVYHSAVWTGSEMIVWGGADASVNSMNDGGRYNPSGNSWSTITLVGAPVGRWLHTAVWTGTEMIVWGGISHSGSSSQYFNDTFSYTPSRAMYLYLKP